MGDVVNGWRLNDLVLVEQRVRDQRYGLSCFAIEIVVPDDPVLRGRHAGHKSRMVWPGHRRKRTDQSVCPSPLTRQLSQRRHVSLRIVEIEAGKPVDTHQNDTVIVLWLSTFHRTGPSNRDKKHEYSRSPECSVHSKPLFLMESSFRRRNVNRRKTAQAEANGAHS